MSPDELPGLLEGITRKASRAAPPAVMAMAYTYQRYVQNELARLSHPAGTRTPSPPGAPPALVTGRLRQSVHTTPGAAGLVATADVSPDTIYAVIQEYGGTVHAHPGLGRKGKQPHTMHFVTDGVHRFPLEVTLPPRPYMAPATAATVANGSLHRAALAAFTATVWG